MRFQTAASSSKKLSLNGKVTVTINSKVTTQKTSLKKSKVSFNQGIDPYYFKNNNDYSK
jgi:hypothetical protein